MSQPFQTAYTNTRMQPTIPDVLRGKIVGHLAGAVLGLDVGTSHQQQLNHLGPAIACGKQHIDMDRSRCLVLT